MLSKPPGHSLREASSITEIPNALTVDVEDYFHVSAFAPNISPDSWSSRESRVVHNTRIFPVHHDRYGIPDAERAPHQMATPGGQMIVEWPLATAMFWGLRVPVAGGGYFRLLPYRLSRWGLESINRRDGQPFIFYLH